MPRIAVGRVAAAARLAGKDRKYFYVLMKKHRIDPEDYRNRIERSVGVSPQSSVSPPGGHPDPKCHPEVDSHREWRHAWHAHHVRSLPYGGKSPREG